LNRQSILADVRRYLKTVGDPCANQSANTNRNAPRTMPCGIVVSQRVVIYIRIPVPRLRALALLGDQAVGLGEAAQGGVVPSCIVKVQAKVGGVTVLPGVLVFCGGVA
jgi:hypothetical protein